jgi:uncharacterized membrane protein YeaQ/YmgE (transglycosylase-associated protein family)
VSTIASRATTEADVRSHPGKLVFIALGLVAAVVASCLKWHTKFQKPIRRRLLYELCSIALGLVAAMVASCLKWHTKFQKPTRSRLLYELCSGFATIMEIVAKWWTAAGILQWKLMPAKKKVTVWETMDRLLDDRRAAFQLTEEVSSTSDRVEPSTVFTPATPSSQSHRPVRGNSVELADL